MVGHKVKAQIVSTPSQIFLQGAYRLYIRILYPFYRLYTHAGAMGKQHTRKALDLGVFAFESWVQDAHPSWKYTFSPAPFMFSLKALYTFLEAC